MDDVQREGLERVLQNNPLWDSVPYGWLRPTDSTQWFTTTTTDNSVTLSVDPFEPAETPPAPVKPITNFSEWLFKKYNNV